MMKRIIAVILMCIVLAWNCCAESVDYPKTIDGQSVIDEFNAQRKGEDPPFLKRLVEQWNEYGINVKLPDQQISTREEDHTWDWYTVGKGFEIIYTLRYKSMGDTLLLEIPTSWCPYHDALSIAIAYALETEMKDGETILNNLIYNLLTPAGESFATPQSEVEFGPIVFRLTEIGEKYTLHIFRDFDK